MSERFSASKAGRLMICPGSANLELSIPGWQPPVVDEEAGAKGKGHRLHEILADLSELPAKDMEAMAACLSYAASIRRKRRFKVLTEYEMVADWLDTAPTTTLDTVYYVQDELHIFDWKTGKIPVYADHNVQAMFYAVTAAHLAPKAQGVHIHIVQPWAADPKSGFNGISYWYADTAALLKFQQDAVDAEKKIVAKSTHLEVSDHCTFCPAFPHSRGDRGTPLCPVAMRFLYPLPFDEEAILNS